MKRSVASGCALVVIGTALQSSAIEVYRAQEVQPYRASEIQPYRGSDIQPYRGSDIQPYQAQPTPRSRDVGAGAPAAAPAGTGRSAVTTPGQAASKPPAPALSAPAAVGQAKALVGTWQTNIPGAVYTTPSSLPGYDTLHVSSGAAAGLLRISPNGTYSWNSYGGKKGKWVETRDPEYPIEIIDTVENRRWKVGYSTQKRALIIWSGSFWYEGQRAEIRKK